MSWFQHSGLPLDDELPARPSLRIQLSASWQAIVILHVWIFTCRIAPSAGLG